MKIGSTPDPRVPDRLAQGATDARAAGRAESGSSATPSVPAADAARLSQLEARLAQSDFDTKKVDEVRSAIANGTFSVDSGLVADRLLAGAAAVQGRST